MFFEHCRTVNVLRDAINRHILPGTILVTDGYPSYPSVARELSMHHIIVNHSEGFRNAEGFHTNYIENLWSDLKLYISSMHGVIYSQYNFYLTMFTFKKNILIIRINKI